MRKGEKAKTPSHKNERSCAIPPNPRRMQNSIVRKHRPEMGRWRVKKSHDRVMFVMYLVQQRFSYPEIAGMLAKKYGLTVKTAYNWLRQMNKSAAREMETWDSADMVNIFQRMVISIEDSIRKSKQANDHKTVIQGELALARIFGFDKGTFIAAIQERREAKKTKQVESNVVDSRALLAKDMNDLTVRQLEGMLKNPDVEEALGEGHGGTVEDFDEDDD